MRLRERVFSVRWLVAAAAVHALLLTGLWRARAPEPQAPVAALPRAVATEIEVALDVQEPRMAPGVANAGAAAQPPSVSEPVPGTARNLRSAPLVDAPSAAEPSQTALAGDDGASAFAITSSAPTETPGPSSAPAAAAPTRSLAELGYGKTLGATVSPYLEYAPLAAAQARLDRNLAQATLDRDRNRSQGMDGPFANALRQAAFAVVAPDSLAKVALIIDADGKLADFRIVSSNQDPALLRKLAEGVARELAWQRIRMPNGRAIEFIYEVKSEVLLPSGRPRGLAPPAVVLTLPGVALDADPVDIGAVGRQVVHTRLLGQRVL
jgi:hypothetical protein